VHDSCAIAVPTSSPVLVFTSRTGIQQRRQKAPFLYTARPYNGASGDTEAHKQATRADPTNLA